MNEKASAKSGYGNDKAATASWDNSSLLATGGLLGAIAASACCLLPVSLFAAGLSGAWIGNLTALAPYAIFFKVSAVLLVAADGWQVYGRATPRGAACAVRPIIPMRVVKIGLWCAAGVTAAAILFPYVADYLLEV